MSQLAPTRRDFATSPAARTAAAVHTLLVLEGMLLLGTAPGLLLLGLLAQDTGNLPLAALALVPLGPALAAALHAWQHRSQDLTDLHPARAYWHGYRANLGDSLRIWLPALAWLTVLGTNLTHLRAAGLGSGWAVGLTLLAVGSLLWTVNALVIASLFRFRTRDTARLAAWTLLRCGRGTVGNACVLAAVLATALGVSALLPLLAGSLLTAAVLLNSRQLVHLIREEFTR